MSGRIDRCVAGAALAPLTNEEKTRLVLVAREAYEKGCAYTPTPTYSQTHTHRSDFDAWRRQQVMLCVERPGLTACRHEDYNHVLAHFLRMLGKSRAADRREERAAMQPRQQALWRLKRELQAAADVIENAHNYVAVIANSKFKTRDLEELSAKQLWTLVFDIRRAAQKRRAKVEGVPF